VTFGSLFAGIGGFDLGFERAGLRCEWQVEIDDYCRRVLAKHWPDVRRWDDVRTFPPAGDWTVDVICGGFPCQDIALSGTGLGLAGERSGLWFEYLRIVRLLRPSFVVIENSAALLIRGADRVLCDLAASGFDAEWQVVRASDFTLPHRRERLFIVAYANGEHGTAWVGTEQNGTPEIFPRRLRQRDATRIQAADHLIGMDDGIRGRTYRLRGHAVGNAVCPAVAHWIGRRLMESNRC
jgi:DNA (cytosine-5)-methyltransferase 1